MRADPVCVAIKPPFGRVSLSACNLVERFFNKIKHCRRAATRY